MHLAPVARALPYDQKEAMELIDGVARLHPWVGGRGVTRARHTRPADRGLPTEDFELNVSRAKAPTARPETP